MDLKVVENFRCGPESGEGAFEVDLKMGEQASEVDHTQSAVQASGGGR